MIRRPFLFACLAWIFTAGAVLPRADAQTSVTTTGTDATVVMHVGDPYSGPAIQIQGNPDIVVVPGTKVSYIKNGDYDMYEVGDVWYYRYDGNWYRASDYKGPYTYVTTTTVPRSVRTVPKKYRHTTWTTTTTTTTQTSMSPTSGTTRSKSAVQSRQKARTSRYSKSTRAKRSRAKTTTSSTTSTTSSTTESGMSGSDMSGMSSGTSSMGTGTGTVVVGQTYSGPAITFSTQPTIETVPGSEVSYIKDTDYDMYRVGSDWYMNYNGNWYRASNYTGPYVVVETTTVPTAVISVPVNYRKHWSH